ERVRDHQDDAVLGDAAAGLAPLAGGQVLFRRDDAFDPDGGDRLVVELGRDRFGGQGGGGLGEDVRLYRRRGRGRHHGGRRGRGLRRGGRLGVGAVRVGVRRNSGGGFRHRFTGGNDGPRLGTVPGWGRLRLRPLGDHPGRRLDRRLGPGPRGLGSFLHRR